MIRATLATLALIVTATVARADIEIQQITSPGGIEAWLVEEHGIPFVSIEISFLGGVGLDLPGKGGAANLMTGLIEEGAGEMDATEFQTAREALAASFGFDAYADNLYISARVLTENRDTALALLREALVTPRFDDIAIERVRGQVLNGLRADAQDPGTIAADAWFAAAYPDHPYGVVRGGTAESVAALTRDDIVTAHRNLLVRDRVQVSAVGDITAEELGLALDALLGDLPEGGPELPGRADYVMAGGIDVIDFPTPQSEIYFGQAGLTREDPDFFAAFVLNRILGQGSFESRLWNELREKRGLTYGVGTNLWTARNSEAWIGALSTANANVPEVVAVIVSEWRRLAADGVTEAELEAAKTYLIGEYPMRFDGNGHIASIMLGMQIADLPPSYVTERNELVAAVTLEDVNRVAAQYLDADALAFVIVGQPEGMEPGVIPVLAE